MIRLHFMSDRRNITFLIVLEGVWSFGNAFIAFDIISALIHSLGGGPLLVATASIGFSVLTCVPQLFVPYLQQRIARPIRGSALTQILIVASWGTLTIALAVTRSPKPLLAIIVGAMTVAGLGYALNSPYYQQVRLRLFPSRMRAASYSTLLFFSQITGTAGALLCVPLLTAGGGPTQHNYFLCFVIASVTFMLSTVCYAFLRDPHPPAAEPTPVWRPLSVFLQGYVEILRTDRRLRLFLWSESLIWLSTIGPTFLTYYAVGRFGEGIAAQCSLARIGGGIGAVPLAHWLVASVKPRGAMLAMYLCRIAVCVCMVLPLSRGLVWAATVLLGVAAVIQVSYTFHFVAALCDDANRTKYFALTGAAMGPVALLAPLIGAWLLQLTANNYPLLFAVSLLPLLAGGGLVWRCLTDPVGAEGEFGTVPRITLKRLRQ